MDDPFDHWSRGLWIGGIDQLAGDAVGKRVNLCSLNPTPCWCTIVGVVGNVHQYGLEAEPTLDIYFTGGWTQYVVISASSDLGNVTISPS